MPNKKLITIDVLETFYTGLKTIFLQKTHLNALAKNDNTVGHVVLVSGDVKDETYSPGKAAASAHTHSQYAGATHNHDSVYVKQSALASELANYATKSSVVGVARWRASIASVPTDTDIEDRDYIAGDVFNITTSFTTTAQFKEGAGVEYPAGTNIILVAAPDGDEILTAEWDVLGSNFSIDETTVAEIGSIDMGSGIIAGDYELSQKVVTTRRLTAFFQGLKDVFALVGHNHDSDYASINHNHDSDYASIDHNHDATYATIEHTHNIVSGAFYGTRANDDSTVPTGCLGVVRKFEKPTSPKNGYIYYYPTDNYGTCFFFNGREYTPNNAQYFLDAMFDPDNGWGSLIDHLKDSDANQWLDGYLVDGAIIPVFIKLDTTRDVALVVEGDSLSKELFLGYLSQIKGEYYGKADITELNAPGSLDSINDFIVSRLDERPLWYIIIDINPSYDGVNNLSKYSIHTYVPNGTF